MKLTRLYILEYEHTFTFNNVGYERKYYTEAEKDKWVEDYITKSMNEASKYKYVKAYYADVKELKDIQEMICI